MNFSWSCCGAGGVFSKIIPPEIDKICPKCGHQMELLDGRGFRNSGTHTFFAKCLECGEKLSFDDYALWKRCLYLSDKQREKHDKMILAETKRLLKLRTREFNVSSFVKSFLYESLKKNNIRLHNLKIATKDGFKKFNLKDIKSISMCKTKYYGDNFYFEFIRQNDTQMLYETSDVYNKNLMENLKDYHVAKIDNSVDFAQELFKLIYLAGGRLSRKKRSDINYLTVKTLDNKEYYLCSESILNYFVYDYFKYYIELFKLNSTENKPFLTKNVENNFLKDDVSKKLYLMLYRIFKNKKTVVNMLLWLETEKPEMLKFLESGETDKEKIIYKMVELTKKR